MNDTMIPRIKAETLLEKIERGADFLLLDVRTSADYESWPVRWIRPVQDLNIPYYDFMEHREESMARIPREKEIVVVCNRGNASDEIAQVLSDAGYRAHSVQNGMKSWGSVYHAETIYEEQGVCIIQFNRFAKGCLSYLLVSDGEAALVDPSRHTEQYLEYLKRHDLKLRYIFDTHLHADHISGAATIVAGTDARYIINDRDMDPSSPIRHETPGNLASYPLGSTSVDVVTLHTPGHTPGSTSYRFHGRFLMTGDILFLSSMGRPDLGGQASVWVKDLWNTVRNLETLPDDTVILPAHSAGLSEFDERGRVLDLLGNLRKRNRLLTIRDEKAFEKEILAHLPEEPETYQKMRRTNMGHENPDEETRNEWELGKNRCAVEAYREKKGL